MASGISLSGYSSGIDTATIVSQLMAVERQPLDKLNEKRDAFEARLSAYSELRTKLSGLRTAAGKLDSIREFRKFSATSTDTDDEHFSASVSSSAQATSHTVKVLALARSEREISQGFSTTTAAIATGDFKIQVGTGSWQTVTIDSSNATLEGLRNAINNGDYGVTASIMNDGDATNPYRLVITSDETGTANSIEIDTSAMSGGTVPAFTETQAALDAQVEFDGMTITSATNEIDDIVTGVSLDLKKIDATNEYTLTIASDTQGIIDDIKDFVEQYNTVMSYLEEKGGATATDRDTSLQQIIRELRAITYTSVASGGEYTGLSQVGISTNSSGQLVIDEDELTTALDDNFEDVAKLLTAYGGSSDSNVRFLNSRTATQDGTYAIEITGVGASLAGTIGGYAAYASGTNILVGAEGTPVEGLSIYFTGQTAGSYGEISYSSGIFEKFDRLLERYLDTGDGLITAREESVNRQIRYLDADIARKEIYLERVEERLNSQFTAMELALSNLEQQGNFLTGMS